MEFDYWIKHPYKYVLSSIRIISYTGRLLSRLIEMAQDVDTGRTNDNWMSDLSTFLSPWRHRDIIFIY